jgi:hypothetical protein
MYDQTTLLSHIYNEEYLLPFWLEHHKNMFDNIVIVDYRSTDKSMEICKRICPECTILTTRNESFGANEVDREMMDLENTIPGIKMVLNVTEFLFCERPIKELFLNIQTSYSVIQYSAYSHTNYHINEDRPNEIITNLLNKDVVFVTERGTRQIHNFQNGNYSIGRHGTHNPTSPTNDIHIVWCGYYPFNDITISRKLQIKQNIPQSDIACGNGFHHLYPKEKMIEINTNCANIGLPLDQINPSLYNIVKTLYI